MVLGVKRSKRPVENFCFLSKKMPTFYTSFIIRFLLKIASQKQQKTWEKCINSLAQYPFSLNSYIFTFRTSIKSLFSYRPTKDGPTTKNSVPLTSVRGPSKVATSCGKQCNLYNGLFIHSSPGGDT